jgi:hypothetical protein
VILAAPNTAVTASVKAETNAVLVVVEGVWPLPPRRRRVDGVTGAVRGGRAQEVESLGGGCDGAVDVGRLLDGQRDECRAP